MPSKVTFTCAVCGAIKGEVNHWYTYCIRNSGVLLSTFNTLHEDDYGTAEADCVCGQKCLHAILDKWLATQRTPKEIA